MHIYVTYSNTPSLDVLPVKGPQGPALIIPESNMQVSLEVSYNSVRFHYYYLVT